MTLLCAPVKKMKTTTKVDLQEIDEEGFKTIIGKAAYIDIDWKTKTLPSGKVIVSYHNFEETPDLDDILKILQEAHPQAHFYKIATMARSTLDSLRMMEFLQKHPGVIGLCMGELGTITRICAPLFQVPIMYAPLQEEEKNAPGQLLVDQLQEIYHFRALNPQTKIFGLIGDPVYRSIGHLFHNDFFRRHHRNAVYVKMVIKPEELAPFFTAIKKLPFAGLSVTAPLKEAILPFIDVIDPKAQAIGAVNTLAFRNNKVYGYNTDGDAALDILGNARNKTLVVLGAGGAAKAIIYTAVQRGCHVVIVNRTPEKAEELARLMGCAWSKKIPSYDILVNTTSVSMPIDAQAILSGKIVMDIAVYETEFLKEAQRKGCFVLNGFPMFFQQALAQQAIWQHPELA
ncbi:MAG: shikimate dehydrogenase [Verrucomicrobia bacterium]|nr:shikimate dehydrogenase [Verrucomicrobiota bacterium]